MSGLWEIYALKYAERNERTRADSFLDDSSPATQHNMDYFIWVLKSDARTIIVDTGYDFEEGRHRDRPILRAPAAMLSEFGCAPHKIDTVILTHLHYDHAGNIKDFPKAQMHLQQREMNFATGPCMCDSSLKAPYTGQHICDAVRCLYTGRITWADGEQEIAPGVRSHLIGGHSLGLQCVTVETNRGTVVLASDASHYYENFMTGALFPIVADKPAMHEGFARIRALASSDDHIIPGHDPLVRDLYPAVGGNNDVVALHASPKRKLAGIFANLNNDEADG
jgi:glyoxylase-like metal-dependent hydrolase (beta-lactamase superfamily II)